MAKQQVEKQDSYKSLSTISVWSTHFTLSFTAMLLFPFFFYDFHLLYQLS